MALLLPKLQLEQQVRRQRRELKSLTLLLNIALQKREITHITVCDIQRGVSEMSSTTGQPVSRHMRPFLKGENQEYHLKEW